MRIIIILSIFLISFTNFFYAQESYQSIYTGQQLDSAAGSFLGNDFYRIVGGGEKNYPLSVQGLKEAIASLDSGIVYIEYPGLWDTVGVGVIPGKVQVSGWLFGELLVNKQLKINTSSFIFGKDDGFFTNDQFKIQPDVVGSSVIGEIRQKDSSQPAYWGVIVGTSYGSYFNMAQNAETPLTPWRTWDDNQAQLISGPSNINGLNISTTGLHDIIFSYDNWTELGRFKGSTGNLKLINRLVQKVNINNISNPPTAAELNTAFPNAEEGEMIFIDDNNGGTNFYKCIKEGANWWIFLGTKAL